MLKTYHSKHLNWANDALTVLNLAYGNETSTFHNKENLHMDGQL